MIIFVLSLTIISEILNEIVYGVNIVLKITGYNTYVMQKHLVISPYHIDMSASHNPQIFPLDISTLLSMIKLILKRNGRN